MITVCTWMWGSKFGPDDVARLAAGFRRHLKQPHIFVCFSDRPFQGIPGIDKVGRILNPELLKEPGCFARLRMFDPQWQYHVIGFSDDDRLVCVDLDTVVTGPLDPLFDRPESFVIMQGGNAANPCPYNGALMMLRPGAHPEVWTDFSLEEARKLPYYAFPDDQGWIAHKVKGAAGWKCGSESGVYVFQKPGWPGGKKSTALPKDARLVTVINRSIKDMEHLDWVKGHWR